MTEDHSTADGVGQSHRVNPEAGGEVISPISLVEESSNVIVKANINSDESVISQSQSKPVDGNDSTQLGSKVSDGEDDGVKCCDRFLSKRSQGVTESKIDSRGLVPKFSDDLETGVESDDDLLRKRSEVQPRGEAESQEPEAKSPTLDDGLEKLADTESSISEKKLGDSIENLVDELDKKSNECILEPLEFPESPPKDKGSSKQEKVHFDEEFEAKFSPDETPCVLCDNVYKDINEKSQYDEYLCHLIVEHKLVVADVKLIANLRKYVLYWKRRLVSEPVEKFCAVISTNMSPKDVGNSEKYFLLCDALLEDRKVREELQLIRLKELIEVQSAERDNEEFERMCLFCTKFFIGNRNALFNHLNEDHNFNVGHPLNLIYADEFLDELEGKLRNLECLFCEKVFKERASLKEHMRKKSHRRLNPKNKHYDKYYIINYLELGKNWELLQGEPDQLESPEDWSGWEDEGGQTAVCFFCSASFSTQDRLFEHMKDSHDFDFQKIRKDMNLSFYQQVKMVNYIRRMVHQLREGERKSGSEDNAGSKTAGSPELAKTIRGCISTSTKWNQPQYYFPTYENDNLLCQLEDKDGLFEPEDNFIIGEDGIDCKTIINESILTDLVVQGYFD